jgi:tRNA threonylcarbamoyladenosine biosynthesis protein TsaE
LKQLKMITEVPESADMEVLGGKVAAVCLPGTRVFLQGGLGAGKTTFVRGFLRQLGYQGAVKSPTYTLVEPYDFSGKIIYHFDLYRLHSPAELEHIGLRDYFDTDAICLVEWPEKAGTRLGRADLLIQFEFLESGRRLVLTAQTPAGQVLIQHLK